MSVYDDNDEDFIYEELLEFIQMKDAIRLLEIVLDVIRNTQGEQNRPQGEWHKNLYNNYVCNKCSYVIDGYAFALGHIAKNYCPNCGARMTN